MSFIQTINRRIRILLSLCSAGLLLATSVMGQNPETPPPGIAAPPTMAEVINSTMEQYAPQLQNMTESELAAEDSHLKTL